MMGLKFDVHEILDLMRIHIPEHHDSQIVGDEIHHVMILLDLGKHLKNAALFWIFNVILNGKHPRAPDLIEHHVQHA